MATAQAVTLSALSGAVLYAGRFAPGGQLVGGASLDSVAAGGSLAGAVAPGPAVPSTGSRMDAEFLFQPAETTERASQILAFPADVYRSDRWGPTAWAVSEQTGWTWDQQGGDWRDANNTRWGTVPWGTVAVPQGTVGQQYSVDITAALLRVQSESRWAAFLLDCPNAPRTVAGPLHPTAGWRPVVDVTYQGGGTATLACRVLAQVTTSSVSPITALPGIPLSAFVEFERPAATPAVTGAQLRFVCTEQFSGASPVVRVLGLLDPPINTWPNIDQGSMSEISTQLDAGMASEPGVLYVHRYEDARPQSDFLVDRSSLGHLSKSSYSPAIYGGTDNASLWPTLDQGKWIKPQPQAGQDYTVTVVPSSYGGEGFAPVAAGLGALRINMPAYNVQHGDEVGNSGRQASNLIMNLPLGRFGLQRRLRWRYAVRLGTPWTVLPEHRKHVLSAGAPRWTDLAGKFGIGADCETSYGGVSGTSGGPRGWLLRNSWYECDTGLAGPDYGGVIVGHHITDDFKGNQPAGHRYGQAGDAGVWNAREERWGQQGGWGGRFYPGRWYWVENELVLNSVTAPSSWAADGEYRTWVDGHLVWVKTGLVFRTLPVATEAELDPSGFYPNRFFPCRELGIARLRLTVFHGGQSESTYPRTLFYSGLVVTDGE